MKKAGEFGRGNKHNKLFLSIIKFLGLYLGSLKSKHNYASWYFILNEHNITIYFSSPIPSMESFCLFVTLISRKRGTIEDSCSRHSLVWDSFLFEFIFVLNYVSHNVSWKDKMDWLHRIFKKKFKDWDTKPFCSNASVLVLTLFLPKSPSVVSMKSYGFLN